MENNLSSRLFEFAVKAVELTKVFGNTSESWIIKRQLIKSATSAGANYEEAQAGSTKPEFIAKVLIALREMRESRYWLRIALSLPSVCKTPGPDFFNLIKESEELVKILGAIAASARKNKS